ncbi:universal stress protein [Spirosoma sp. HMF4905]|uniref:Universal stress protein n=1 Tax=Spirosoma arboris TaxID=2682092 RepID=A0A7K1SJE1_9BACT|nr:universal stress protein [Spirosoma arboris]MVM33931.1 universal stress protein [Spirosoma arboris]
MKKILLLTDFSAASEHAIHFAQALFSDATAQFCLVNAYPLEADTTYNTEVLAETYRQYAEENLKKLLHTIRGECVPAYHSYRGEIIPGWPVGAVEAILASESFDLVVVGATGKGNSEWIGSVATGLIRQLKTAVLVVPATAPIRPLSNIVLASDYQLRGETAVLKPLNELATFKNTQLTLLTIEDPDNRAAWPSVNEQAELLSYFDTIETDVYCIHDDDVLHGINSYLDTHTVDLLVTVPHQKGWLEALTGQSVSRHLAYRPRVPLLTLYDGVAIYPEPETETSTRGAWQEES